MDQESFRRLLSSSSQSQSRTQRESLFTQKGSSSKPKPATISSNEVAFKPRKVKKSEGKYRDRAAERRVGEGNDYAEVEAVLEEFEKRTADQDKNAINEQRRYLGGDSDHSVLVKGLDMALLQQNKARAATTTDEDDSLEKAYAESTVPKKRTREDIIRELKEKRSQGASDEQPKQASEGPTLKKDKFKPIGFKPIGASTEEKEKKKKVKGEGERKKKKRKVVAESGGPVEASAKATSSVEDPVPSTSNTTVSIPVKEPPMPVQPEEPEPPEDLDIFAGAGEYEGVDLGDDEDEDEDEDGQKKSEEKDVDDLPGDIHTGLGPGRWFTSGSPEPAPSAEAEAEASHSTPDVEAAPGSTSHPTKEEENVSEDEEPTRLVPLASSALPSIKDFLAMDNAADAADKKRRRKDKKKGIKDESSSSKKLDTEAKVNRDYQRLKSYTDKRGDSSK